MMTRIKNVAPPARTLDDFADAHSAAKYAENQEISRQLRAVRSTLTERDKEVGVLRDRLAAHEEPSTFKVEALLGKKTTLTRQQIAKALDLDLTTVDRVLRDMSERGYNVQDGVLSRTAGAPRATVEHFYGHEVRFGIVSDTHIGNHHAMEEQLHEAYAVFQREGIERVYAPGNLLDGEKTYRGQEYEISVMGADNCVANLARVWPRIPGITTYHVASSTCHEGYYLKSAGLLIGKLIQSERPDMVYLGLDEADVVLHDSPARPVLRIVHPGGGTSYAESYRPQKIVESYSGGEKPAVLVIGHYHKAGYYDIRNVATFQAGCLERQTPFMRKHSLAARTGFWIIELRFTEHGSLRRVRAEWFKYYVGEGGKILRDWTVT
jgi:predicted phosphodiesterase